MLIHEFSLRNAMLWMQFVKWDVTKQYGECTLNATNATNTLHSMWCIHYDECDESNVMNTMWWIQYDKCNFINAMCWMHCAKYNAMISN